MSSLAGIFLIAHGLVHVAVWLAPERDDAPFDPCHSWLLGRIVPVARLLAASALVVFVTAGVMLLSGAEAAAVTAMVGALTSLMLIALTFNRWLFAAVVINVAIAALALT